MEFHIVGHLGKLVLDTGVNLDTASQIGVLRTGERIAVALLCRRLDWLKSEFRHPLDAIDRLGLDDLKNVIAIHRSGWRRTKLERSGLKPLTSRVARSPV